MDLIKRLTCLKRPYLHISTNTNKDVIKYALPSYKDCRKHIFCEVIDGCRCGDLDGLFNEFANVFSFPDYFGENWAAFDECINDLSWIKAEAYITIINSIDEVLKNEDEDFEIFISYLIRTIDEWVEGRTYNESFPTPPTPFHVIFLCSKDKKDKVLKRLKQFNIEDVSEIIL